MIVINKQALSMMQQWEGHLLKSPRSYSSLFCIIFFIPRLTGTATVARRAPSTCPAWFFLLDRKTSGINC